MNGVVESWSDGVLGDKTAEREVGALEKGLYQCEES